MTSRWEPGRVLPLFPADANARHDKMVGLVETMLELHKDLPKAKTPHEQESMKRQIPAIDRQIDTPVYVTKEEISFVAGEEG